MVSWGAGGGVDVSPVWRKVQWEGHGHVSSLNSSCILVGAAPWYVTWDGIPLLPKVPASFCSTRLSMDRAQHELVSIEAARITVYVGCEISAASSSS